MNKYTLILCFLLAGCGNTFRGPAGAQGTAGATGATGSQGSTGPQGNNGQDGTNGQDAQQSPYDIVGIVDPCGDAPGVYDEVFFRLRSGILVASFSDNANGNNTRFSVLSPGNYITTDGSGCHFTVTADGQIQ